MMYAWTRSFLYNNNEDRSFDDVLILIIGKLGSQITSSWNSRNSYADKCFGISDQMLNIFLLCVFVFIYVVNWMYEVNFDFTNMSLYNVMYGKL